ncbi:hypothetical protein EV361DRAFT_938453 [Lentinula raphanica]|nr:hypothetical protein EV361DRAFT_938453 [Lentinula raphanica]
MDRNNENLSKLKIIRNGLKEAMNLVQTQQALMTAERERQIAESQLVTAQDVYQIREFEVKAQLEEMNERVEKLVNLAAQLNDKVNDQVDVGPTPISSGTPSPVVSPPPSPTKSRVEKPTSPVKHHREDRASPIRMRTGTPPPTKIHMQPPASPNKETVATSLATTSLAGTTIQGPEVPVSIVYKGSKHPAYVVYQGQDRTHGLFFAWTSISNVIVGADSICNPALHSYIVGSFNDVDRARAFYKEYVDTGVAVLLQNNPAVACENFIVCHGVKPGVYDNRKSLILTGLQYRGGVVVRYIGSYGDALAQLEAFRAEGKVKIIHSKRDHF